MTAHATIEERQRCLAAGMNDHIAKPIDPGNLFATVARFYAPADGGSAAVDAGVAPLQHSSRRTFDDPPTVDGLDTKGALSRVGGNRQLYLKLLGQFVEQQGPVLGQIDDALSRKDNALAERLAHTLKGVAGQDRRRAGATAAGRLEQLIRDRAEAKDVEAARAQVAAQLVPLVTALRAALPPTAAGELEHSTARGPGEPCTISRGGGALDRPALGSVIPGPPISRDPSRGAAAAVRRWTGGASSLRWSTATPLKTRKRS